MVSGYVPEDSRVRDSLVFVVPMIATFTASSMLTRIVHRYALAKRFFDIPNTRSMHRTPIPRGGGIAIDGSLEERGAPSDEST